MTGISFVSPPGEPEDARHHGEAAAANVEATTAAIGALADALAGDSDDERILLRAAAGAGKSYALKRMVDQALTGLRCQRVGVVAFTNKQIVPLAEDLGTVLGRGRVCLRVAPAVALDLPASVRAAVTVAATDAEIPSDTDALIATASMLGRPGNPYLRRLGGVSRGRLFDVLFVDEAWQLAQYLYRPLVALATVVVGVGDVGQLPPLDPGQNPWRGDPGYNPYRAWPTSYETDRRTWSVELPAVWRPTSQQLPLWRAFYPDWSSLDCVAAPGDRSMLMIQRDQGHIGDIWERVATGEPTLVEVEGLAEPDAPDVDPPLLAEVERWLDVLFSTGFELHEKEYDDLGLPIGERVTTSADPQGRTLVAVLATRNQAVDDAQEMVERLSERHGLPDGAVVASTVDSWQGQTNAITIAIHPLSGASRLDDFNSAFGRLAVVCTRATHGLLLVGRRGLDDLLATSPARPGTPMGEPGNRQLPRQTHERILRTFARGSLVLEAVE